jgi:hypothetical protein
MCSHACRFVFGEIACVELDCLSWQLCFLLVKLKELVCSPALSPCCVVSDLGSYSFANHISTQIRNYPDVRVLGEGWPLEAGKRALNSINCSLI